MIRFTLRCDQDHTFDSWFRSGAAFDKLRSAGMVSCSICGSDSVEKAIMAPRVRPARNAAGAPEPSHDIDKPLSAPASAAEQVLAELRRKVEANSDYVGRDFAAEARRIHNGEAPARSIFGEAQLEEARTLAEDGVPVAALPWTDRRKAN